MKRLAWLRLNADSVLISILVLLRGLDLIDPEKSDIVVALGYVPATFYFWTIMYVISGILMMIGLIKGWIGPELLGRFLVWLSFGWEVARSYIVLGSNLESESSLAIWILLTITFSARASMLLSKHGVTVVVAPRQNGHTHE